MSVTISSEVPAVLTLTLQPVSFFEFGHPVVGRVGLAALDVAGPGHDVKLAFAGADFGHAGRCGRFAASGSRLFRSWGGRRGAGAQHEAEHDQRGNDKRCTSMHFRSSLEAIRFSGLIHWRTLVVEKRGWIIRHATVVSKRLVSCLSSNPRAMGNCTRRGQRTAR